MTSIPYKSDDLAASLNAFAKKIEPALDRWRYCYGRCTYIYHSQRYGSDVGLNMRTMAVCGRILGVDTASTKLRMQRIRMLGFEGAVEWAKAWDKRPFNIGHRPAFWAGPLQPWHIGHLYFARVVDHPHVVKVGFSRRVRERFEDIESRCKTKLVMRPKEIRVGTLADEHWWHKHWAAHRISGEWFFDPQSTDRSLPAFLVQHAQAEAA